MAYVWAGDLDVVMRASHDLRAPFGGYKLWGVGRDGATSSVELFTELKTTTIPIG